MNELVTIENNEIKVNQEVIKRIEDFNAMKKEIEYQEKLLKQGLLEAMELTGTKHVDMGSIHATYKAPSTRIVVDTKALKADGLYDVYSKKSTVKASVMLKVD